MPDHVSAPAPDPSAPSGDAPGAVPTALPPFTGSRPHPRPAADATDTPPIVQSGSGESAGPASASGETQAGGAAEEEIMPTYKSQGTVSWGIGGPGIWINFVPHGDYLVKHEGQSYAIFLPDGNDKHCIRVRCKDKNEAPIDIRIDPHQLDPSQNVADLQVSELLIWTGASSAAMTHSKVQVEVEAEKNVRDGTEPTYRLKLTGIQSAK